MGTSGGNKLSDSFNRNPGFRILDPVGGPALQSQLDKGERDDARRRKKKAKKARGPKIARKLQNLFSGFESLLAPGEDGGMSRAGALKRASALEDLGLAKELGPQFQALQQQLIDNDPTKLAQQTLTRDTLATATSGLAGLEDGLPDDIERSITERVRSGAASRGLLDSPGAFTSEIAALAGGEENFRNSRLNQARGVLTGTAPTVQADFFSGGMAMQNFGGSSFVNPSSLLGAGVPGVIGGINQQSMFKSQEKAAGKQALGQGVGAGVGLLASMLLA